jgi:mannose/fructose/N-acetylgalactosamine-specific phosphotransferase system component IID
VRTHLGLLVLFAAFVSLIFAVLLRDDRAAQLRYGATIFGAFVIGAVAAGWLMLLFPL